MKEKTRKEGGIMNRFFFELIMFFLGEITCFAKFPIILSILKKAKIINNFFKFSLKCDEPLLLKIFFG